MPQTAARPVVAETPLNALLDAAVDAIILINPRGEITRFNLAAERMFGYGQAEVVGRASGEYLAEGEHGFVGILRDLTQRKAQTREAEELRARSWCA